MSNEPYQALELNKVKEQMTAYCSFSAGRRALLQLEPMFDELLVQRELIRTKEALELVWRYGMPPFQGVHDIEDSVKDAKKDRILTPCELRWISESLRAVLRMQKYFKESEAETPYLKELVSSCISDLKLASAIDHCISLNDEVYDHASSALKEIRKNIRQCEGETAKEVQRFISKHASSLMDTITTKRNDRICVLVKISEKNTIKGFVHGESASGQTAYVEPESLLQLNNHLQTLHAKEQNEIERILFSLSQQVKAESDFLLANLETFTLLDMTFAKAAWGKERNGCIAHMTNSTSHLYFKNARHPLIDPDHVVANTYEVKAPHRILLITGSNTGGKTVTLKTLGLFVALTMCGMPVLADEAAVPFFDQVYVDIGDDQSIQESLSTFSSHISKLADICDHASEHSFILLDELGSGTDPREGEALAVGILHELRQRNAMVIATTHYSGLKSYAAGCEDILLSSVAFDVETMRPTYRFLEGVSGTSNALEIASRYHLKDSIIAYAKQFKENQKTEADITMEQMEQAILENRAAKEKMEERLQDVKKLQEQLEQERQKLQREKQIMIEKIREEADQAMEETKEKAEKILEELKQLRHDAKPHELTKLKKELDELQEEEESVQQSTEVFVVGDYVQLKKLNYYGEIIAVKKDQATVMVNGMRMNTAFQDLQHAKKQIQKKKKDRSYSKTISSSFSMELNVIGLTVREALPIIDKYLDNAILAKVFQVRIIHGNGTGALRTGVHNHLKRCTMVEDFRMGGQGEGGLGATVVTLKQKRKQHG